MSIDTFESCQVCDNPGYSIFGRKTGYDRTVTYTFKKCGRCGFMWVDPFPGYGVYDDKYYRGEGPDPYVDYASEYETGRHGARLPEFKNLWELTYNCILKISRNDKNLKILDYGSGAGGFMDSARSKWPNEWLTDAQLEIQGFDTGSYASRPANEKKFHILTESELNSLSGFYNVITCIEAIKHVREINLTMQNLSRLLKPGGLLILTTGNMRSLAARIAGMNHRYLIPDIDISLFNPACLAMLYWKHGLTPARFKHNGILEYNILKSIRNPRLSEIAAAALPVPGFKRFVDMLYGVSAMPCAVKPQA